MKKLVCESLQEFYITESLSDVKKIFIDANYDIDNEANDFYTQFIENYKTTPEYMGKLATWVIENPDNWERIDNAYNEYIRLKKENLINKSINDFSKLKDFENDIKRVKQEEKQKKDSNETNNTVEKNKQQNFNQTSNVITPSMSLDSSTLSSEKINKKNVKNINKFAKTEDDDTTKEKNVQDNILETVIIYPQQPTYECLYAIKNDDDVHVSGQGLYIWAFKDDLKNENNIFKFGQYGSLGEPKTPLQTIIGYKAGYWHELVLLYAIRFDDNLKKKFGSAFNAEQIISKQIQSRKYGGFKLKDRTELDERKTISKEIFGGITFKTLKEIIHDTLYGAERKDSYKMRPEQKAAHDKMVKYFSNNGTEFLLAAKMRYGKNFTLLNVAKTMNMKNILVLTYKPHVFSTLKENIDDHVLFKDWKWVDFKKERNLKHSTNVTTIFMSSAQLALNENEDIYNNIEEEQKSELIKFKNEQKILDDISSNLQKLQNIIPIDMIIADEYHYGGSTQRFNELIKKLNHKYMVYVSGTAMKDIESGRFPEEAVYTYSYIEEQELKNKEKLKGYGPHLDMPTLKFHLMDISDEAKQQSIFYDKNEQLTMTKIIGTNEKKELNDPGSLRLLLEQIAGTSGHKQLSPFRLVQNIDHSFWVLDKHSNGIKAMAKLMKSMPEYEKYHIIAATGNVVTDIDTVHNKINMCKDAKKRGSGKTGTITLSCYRFKEGTTVPEWDAVIMLDSGKSPEEWLQAIFRAQSPDKTRKKDECHIFDFNPNRCLSRIYDICENTNKSGSESIEKTIRKFLDYAPVLDHRMNRFKNDIDEKDILIHFQSFVSSSLKFSNKKNINVNKIDEEVTKSLINVKIHKRKKDILINKNDIPGGKTYGPGNKKGPKNKDIEELKEDSKKKELIKNIKKILTVLSNIPEYLFNSEVSEKKLDDIILSGNDDLFETITDVPIKTFKMWVEKGVINKILLDRNIVNFKFAEENFINSHPALKEKDNFFEQHFNMRANSGPTSSILINEMFDKLPEHIWQDPNKTFYDPVMGTGTFLIAIKERLMQNLPNSFPGKYSNIKEKENYILKHMLYGSDNNVSKINIAKKLLGNIIHINKEDSLTKNWNGMKFDVVVGNPPYHEVSKSSKHVRKQSGASKIWTKFVYKGINDLLKDTGLLLFVTPNNWIYETNTMKKVFKKHLKYANISQYIAKYFPKIGSSFSYYILSKSNSDKYKIEVDGNLYDNLLDYKFFPKRDITKNKINIFITINKKKDVQYFNWFRKDPQGLAWHPTQTGKYKYQIITGGKDKYFTDIDYPERTMNKVSIYRSKGTQPEFDNNKVPSGAAYISYFNTIEEAKNVVKILNTKLYKLIIQSIRSGLALVSDVNYVPFPININKSWTDQDLYQYYNIDKEDQYYIESFFKIKKNDRI